LIDGLYQYNSRKKKKKTKTKARKKKKKKKKTTYSRHLVDTLAGTGFRLAVSDSCSEFGMVVVEI